MKMMDIKDLIEMKKAISEADVPVEDRCIYLNEKAFTLVFKDMGLSDDEIEQFISEQRIRFGGA